MKVMYPLLCVFVCVLPNECISGLVLRDKEKFKMLRVRQKLLYMRKYRKSIEGEYRYKKISIDRSRTCYSNDYQKHWINFMQIFMEESGSFGVVLLMYCAVNSTDLLVFVH